MLTKRICTEEFMKAIDSMIASNDMNSIRGQAIELKSNFAAMTREPISIGLTNEYLEFPEYKQLQDELKNPVNPLKIIFLMGVVRGLSLKGVGFPELENAYLYCERVLGVKFL